MTTDIQPDWMTPIKQFLTNDTCEALTNKTMKQQTTQFLLINQDLYWRGYTHPLLKCLNTEQASYIMREIHEGVCCTHSGARTMVAKIMSAGYYWSTVHGDCTDYIRKCMKCKEHDNLTHQKPKNLHYILYP